MRDFRELLKSKEGIVTIQLPFSVIKKRIFDKIKLGEYELSIQASEYHYCTPRETLENIYDYDAMEVAIFKNNDFHDISEDRFFYDWAHYEEFLERYDGMVASYLSINIIQSLFEFISIPLTEDIENYFNIVLHKK